jgi:hypothetical protein
MDDSGKIKKCNSGSKDGGMMGDPYQSTKLKRNFNHHHYGGSSWKWGYG